MKMMMTTEFGKTKNFLLFLFVLGGLILGALGLLAHIVHKNEPQLRAECEARGGMLIGTRNELYTCVGKPPMLEKTHEEK